MIKQSLTLAAVGSLVGLIASALLAHWLRSFLFGVSSLDPLTFCTVPTLMLMLGLLAAWIPAQRAASIDPMETLRGE